LRWCPAGFALGEQSLQFRRVPAPKPPCGLVTHVRVGIVKRTDQWSQNSGVVSEGKSPNRLCANFRAGIGEALRQGQNGPRAAEKTEATSGCDSDLLVRVAEALQ